MVINDIKVEKKKVYNVKFVFLLVKLAYGFVKSIEIKINFILCEIFFYLLEYLIKFGEFCENFFL